MSNILLPSRLGWFVRLIINIFYLLNNLIISILIPISKIPLIIFYENTVYSLAINYLHSYLQYLKGCTFEELTINVQYWVGLYSVRIKERTKRTTRLLKEHFHTDITRARADIRRNSFKATTSLFPDSEESSGGL